MSANTLPTGVPGLDTILAGGLSHPSLTVIIGAPGAGKTVLASNIIFNAARQGVKSIIFTSFSEGNEQFIEHMGSMSFFDRSVFGDSVQVFSLSSQIEEQTAPATAITRVIRNTKAKLVLFDGFQSLHSQLPAGQSMREILSALATQIRYLDVTILVTIAGAARDSQFFSEITAADAAIGLYYEVRGRRHQRLLEVVKLRGRAQHPGLHSYRIEQDGVHVFPRIEGVSKLVTRTNTGRASFDLPELDQLLGGGPNIGTTTLVAGAPGVGKTVLGLYWAVKQAQPDAKTVFLTFSEHVEQLKQKAAAFGLDLRGAVEQDTVRVLRISPADLDADRVASMLLAELRSPHVSRIVIDDISVLFHELGDRARDYLSALNDMVYAANITSLYTLEIAPFNGMQINSVDTPLAVLGDNVIVIQQYEIQGGLRRLLAVLRMRLSFFDRTLRELILDEQNVRILAPEESELGLLDTGAKLSGGVAPENTEQRTENREPRTED